MDDLAVFGQLSISPYVLSSVLDLPQCIAARRGLQKYDFFEMCPMGMFLEIRFLLRCEKAKPLFSN